MNINIDQAKKEVHPNGNGYLVGIKFVTDEDAQTILHSIEKDLRIYKNVARLIVRDNMVDIMLSNNATLFSYYFTNKKVLDEVLEKLGNIRQSTIIL